jgi:hypothetical protein
MPVQGHSNGSIHGSPTATDKPSNLDQQPISPVSSSTAEGSPVTSPPYWVHSHRRTVSNISIESIASGAIRLQDNTDGRDDKNEACWAKGVRIDDYVVINGNRTGIGAFVVWNVTVETLSVGNELPVTGTLVRTFTDIRRSGRVHTYTKTILGIRRPPKQASPDVSSLRGCYAATAS